MSRLLPLDADDGAAESLDAAMSLPVLVRPFVQLDDGRHVGRRVIWDDRQSIRAYELPKSYLAIYQRRVAELMGNGKLYEHAEFQALVEVVERMFVAPPDDET